MVLMIILRGYATVCTTVTAELSVACLSLSCFLENVVPDHCLPLHFDHEKKKKISMASNMAAKSITDSYMYITILKCVNKVWVANGKFEFAIYTISNLKTKTGLYKYTNK